MYTITQQHTAQQHKMEAFVTAGWPPDNLWKETGNESVFFACSSKNVECLMDKSSPGI